MTRGKRLAEGVHLAFIGLWFGALLMIGAGAPLVFITMRDLDPFLPDFAAHGGPHYLIAGGHIVRRQFMVCDRLQVVCLLVAGLSLVAIIWRQRFGVLNGVRFAIVIALGLLLAYRFFVLDPVLAADLTGYWEAAARGDGHRASELRSRYDRGHQFEQRLFGATALMVLALLMLGWQSLGRGPRGAGAE